MELGNGSCIEIHSVSVSGLLLIIDLGLSRFSQVQGSETYSKKKKKKLKWKRKTREQQQQRQHAHKRCSQAVYVLTCFWFLIPGIACYTMR